MALIASGQRLLVRSLISLRADWLKMSSRPSSDVAAFRRELDSAKHVVVLTGAGISAESGVPTFRGAGGLWRQYESTSLASPLAFADNPSLVWEFYHYRRELVLTKQPNACRLKSANTDSPICEALRGKGAPDVKIGTSAVVYPAAMFAPTVADRGVSVAEFNIEQTGQTHQFGYHFTGSAAKTVPEALGVRPDSSKTT